MADNTLIISESHYGNSKKIGDILSYILSFSKHVDVNDIPESIDSYKNIVFITSFYAYKTAEKLNKYISDSNEKLKDKNLGLIFVGLEENNLQEYTKYILKYLKYELKFIKFIHGNLVVDKLINEDKVILEKFFETNNFKLKDIRKFNITEVIFTCEEIKDIYYRLNNKIMDEKTLRYELDKFISQHNTCSLATGANTFIRNTPIEYVYYNKYFYFITEGGLKFKGILQNPHVCISIYENYSSMDKVMGLQIEGSCTIIDMNSDEYFEVLKYRKIKKEILDKLKVNLILLKVIPDTYELLNSKFVKKGFNSKQILKIRDE